MAFAAQKTAETLQKPSYGNFVQLLYGEIFLPIFAVYHCFNRWEAKGLGKKFF